MGKGMKVEPQFHFAVWRSSVEWMEDDDLHFDLDHRQPGMI